MRNKLLALALLAVSSVAAFAQVPVIGSQVNSISGYQVNGAAPNSDYLCGNGTFFIPSAGPCAAVFYQTIDLNAIAQNQRFALNFSSFFTATDNASPSRTTIDAAQVGANAVCSNPSSVTVDVYGRTTACTTGITVRTTIQGGGGCVTGSSSFDFCDDTLTFPSGAFPNATSTGVSCNGVNPSDPRAMMTVESKSFTSGILTVVCRTTGLGSVALSFGEIDVIAVH